MQLSVVLIMKIWHGKQIRKDNEEIYSCQSEHWMMTEYH